MSTWQMKKRGIAKVSLSSWESTRNCGEIFLRSIRTQDTRQTLSEIPTSTKSRARLLSCLSPKSQRCSKTTRPILVWSIKMSCLKWCASLTKKVTSKKMTYSLFPMPATKLSLYNSQTTAFQDHLKTWARNPWLSRCKPLLPPSKRQLAVGNWALYSTKTQMLSLWAKRIRIC